MIAIGQLNYLLNGIQEKHFFISFGADMERIKAKEITKILFEYPEAHILDIDLTPVNDLSMIIKALVCKLSGGIFITGLVKVITPEQTISRPTLSWHYEKEPGEVMGNLLNQLKNDYPEHINGVYFWKSVSDKEVNDLTKEVLL